jgi:hypothetical protein
MYAEINFEESERKIAANAIDFPFGILHPLEKAIHVNVDQSNGILV